MYKSPANTVFIGKTVHYLPSCHSTNTIADQLISKGAEEGTIVITDDQFAGKGQKGNSWESEPGMNLTFSIILYPTWLSPSDQFELNKITTLGITDFISRYMGIDCAIKWPNDILYGSGKISGILINNSIKQSTLIDSVIGIGLNVNQDKFKVGGGLSLRNITGREYDLQTILDGLLSAIEKRYTDFENGKKRSISVQYLQRLYGINQSRKFIDVGENREFAGIIRGVDDTGKLIIESGGRSKRFSFKEVSFIPNS